MLTKLRALCGKSLFVLLMLAIPALALAGGLTEDGTSAVTYIRDAIYAITAIGGGLFLLMRVVQVWGDRKTWMDVLIACAYVFMAGAAIIIATACFTAGSSTSI